MNSRTLIPLWLCAVVLTAWPNLPTAAQEKAPPSGAAAAPKYRKLAPGIMKVVKPELLVEETFCRHDIVELLAVDPGFKWARDIPFRRDIWGLEFQFKPMRMIWVDIPQTDTDRMRRQLVWYLIYSVTNSQKVLHPVEQADGTWNVEEIARPLKFIPQFLLEAPEFNKVYPDQLIPVAIGPIRMREDSNRRLLNTVEMSQQAIQPGETVWGVATWVGVDSRIDRFSVYVQGLTNAYRWRDEPGAYKKGDPLGKGRRLSRKTLKLNFWRPGDEFFEHEGEIRYGMPGGLDYEWVWR
jgi:hypothetical protein